MFCITAHCQHNGNPFKTSASIHANPASFLSENESGLAISFALPFVGSALTNCSLSGKYHAKFGSYSCGISSIQAAKSALFEYNLLMGEKFGEKLGFILGSSIYHFAITDGYKDQIAVGINAGISYSFSDNLYLSGFFKNLNIPKLINGISEISPELNLQLGWLSEGKFKVFTGLQGSFHQLPSFYGLFEYEIHNNVALQFGFYTAPFSGLISFEFKMRNFSLSIGSFYHVQTGVSPTSTFSYEK